MEPAGARAWAVLRLNRNIELVLVARSRATSATAETLRGERATYA